MVFRERKQPLRRVPNWVHGDGDKADVISEVLVEFRLYGLQGVRDDWTRVRTMREHKGHHEDFFAHLVEADVLLVLIDKCDVAHCTP